MGVAASVLVLTNELDLGADLVVRELYRRRIGLVRCNTERLPDWRVEFVPGDSWRLTDPLSRTATSETVQGVWWRRPGRPSGVQRPPLESEQAALDDQWQSFAEGLASVPGSARWVSHPAAIRQAEDKALQMRVARRAQFRLPATLVTNDLESARWFVAEQGGFAVAKSLTAAFWTDDESSSFVYARRVSSANLQSDPAAFAGVPVVLQQAIQPKRDVRLTVVGDRTFAAIAESDNVLDWRLKPERAWRPYKLPEATVASAVQLVSTLGLEFGGIDLAVDAEGEHWFLEINPNGEWGWLERAAGLPIAGALADLLIRGLDSP